MNRTNAPDAEAVDPSKARRRLTQAEIQDGFESKCLDIRLELHSMQVTLTVLANIARLGCAISRLAASDNVLDLGIRAPSRVAHRVETCLAQIVGVQSVAAR